MRASGSSEGVPVNRVLVTGATGFIGRHCLDPLIASGYEVHAVTSRQPVASPAAVRWHVADLHNPGQTTAVIDSVRPTHLLHFAWYVAPGQWATSPESLEWVGASVNLLEQFHAFGGQRAVFAGSCTEYDWRYGYCSEDLTPTVPSTVYGASKRALQTLVEAYSSATGLSTAWGRIFFLYGPHEHPERLVASVTRALLSGQAARCSHGRQVRDYLFVRDVAEAFVALLQSDYRGCVNIASGEPVTLRTIVEKIARKLDAEALLQLGAIPAAPSDTPLVVGNPERLRREVRWQPRFGLDEGLDATIASCRAQVLARECV